MNEDLRSFLLGSLKDGKEFIAGFGNMTFWNETQSTAEAFNWIQIKEDSRIISNKTDTSNKCEDLITGLNLIVAYRKVSIEKFRETKIVSVEYFWQVKNNQSLSQTPIPLSTNLRFLNLDEANSSDVKIKPVLFFYFIQFLFYIQKIFS